MREIVPKVSCPTLVFHARQDAVIPFEEGRLIAGLIPGARFVPLENHNHIVLESEAAWQQFVDALNDFVPPTPSRSAASGGIVLGDLSVREHQVMKLVAQGLDNATIGDRLHISERTARNHVSAIFGKLGVGTRAHKPSFVPAKPAMAARPGPSTLLESVIVGPPANFRSGDFGHRRVPWVDQNIALLRNDH